LGVGSPAAAEHDFAVAVDDDQEQSPGVQIDASVESGVSRRSKTTHGEDLLRLTGVATCHAHDRRKAFMSTHG
jgi:hypothetical protein